jgi:transcriptional regulator with XRE-family HTH domain
MGEYFNWIIPMNFPARVIQLRKEKSLTQQELADNVGLHVNQIKKYESGAAQPTLKALVSLAKAFHVSLDTLVFGKDERGPTEDLRLQFEAISQFDDEDKFLAQGLLEGLILKHQAKLSTMRQSMLKKSKE